MTTAGVASVAFVVLVITLYGAWTALAASYQWSDNDNSWAAGAWILWLTAHGMCILIGIISVLEWLGTVAGWCPA